MIKSMRTWNSCSVMVKKSFKVKESKVLSSRLYQTGVGSSAGCHVIDVKSDVLTSSWTSCREYVAMEVYLLEICWSSQVKLEWMFQESVSCSLWELSDWVEVTFPSLSESKMPCFGVSGIFNLKIRIHWWIKRSFGSLEKFVCSNLDPRSVFVICLEQITFVNKGSRQKAKGGVGSVLVLMGAQGIFF